MQDFKEISHKNTALLFDFAALITPHFSYSLAKVQNSFIVTFYEIQHLYSLHFAASFFKVPHFSSILRHLLRISLLYCASLRLFLLYTAFYTRLYEHLL